MLNNNAVSFSGTIVKVGTEVSRFKQGDRIVTNSAGSLRNDARFGAYQQYALTTQEQTAKVGESYVQLASHDVCNCLLTS